ncbi:hypothetical protein KY329_03910 [Candidatus Woesearchaeota archaeon]|nr:hypothetical protein [Candidatus Woesearchaeota archaeon]
MVPQSLINYVRTLLKQGYDIRTIRSTLRGAGYSQYDIQEALAEAQKPQVHTKTLLIIFAILLVLTIVVIVALKLMQPAPVDLALGLNAYKTQVAPGEQLIMTAEITNPSGEETDAILDLETKGPQTLTAPSQEVTVLEKAAVPIAITIPQDAAIGQYTLIATLTYGKKTETATKYFEITQARVETPSVPREEQLIALQKECPGGCDDLNPCTQDSCADGQCVHTPITPCCGNGVCEAGEGTECADCKEAVLTEAQREAAGNPEKAAEKCSEDPANADQCYKEVAKIADDKKYCDYIQESKWKDACLMNFAYDGDYTVCEQLQNKYMKNSCNSLKNLAKFK